MMSVMPIAATNRTSKLDGGKDDRLKAEFRKKNLIEMDFFFF